MLVVATERLSRQARRNLAEYHDRFTIPDRSHDVGGTDWEDADGSGRGRDRDDVERTALQTRRGNSITEKGMQPLQQSPSMTAEKGRPLNIIYCLRKEAFLETVTLTFPTLPLSPRLWGFPLGSQPLPVCYGHGLLCTSHPWLSTRTHPHTLVCYFCRRGKCYF